MKALLIVSWIITGCCVLWFGALFISIKCLNPAVNQSGGVHGQTEINREGAPTLGTSSAPHREGKPSDATNEDSGNFSEQRMVWLTVVLVAVAIVQAYYFVRQLKIMRDGLMHTSKNADAAKEAADATRDAVNVSTVTARTQLRAYVAITVQQFSSFDETHYPKCKLIYVNHGVTPAKGIETRWKLCAIPVGSELPKIERDFLSEKWDLFPNAGTEISQRMVTTVYDGVAFSNDQIAKIRDGTYRIVVGVEVRYFDVFEQQHTTTCFFRVRTADDENMKKLTSNSLESITQEIEVVPGSSRFT